MKLTLTPITITRTVEDETYSATLTPYVEEIETGFQAGWVLAQDVDPIEAAISATRCMHIAENATLTTMDAICCAADAARIMARAAAEEMIYNEAM